ncbi:putative ribonuclease H-like domain-containing protein [Tanacetum coccineum]
MSSLMHKKYCVVFTDDYSRFTWVFFLTTKDETSEILKRFIKEIENLVDKKVKVIRSYNETEFKNKVMDDFCREKCIKREYNIASTPQQNGVAERRNRTLIEAARTIGFKPALSFMRPFGCHVTILNTLDSLGKFDGKGDEGFFVRYSLSSKAFRVYNTRTKRVEENLHIRFLENTPIIEGTSPKWLFDIDSLTQSMNYVPVTAGTISNDSAGTSEENSQDCIMMPICKDTSYFDSPTKNVDNGKPKTTNDAQKQVKDGLNNENAEQGRFLDDSSSKDVNAVGQQVNTASLDVNTGSLKLNDVGPSVSTASPNEEDNTEEEPKVDLGNITNSYIVPTTPNTRIHKDHPIDNVIGEVQSTVQTRRMSKPTSEQGFLSDVYEQKTHDTLNTCLYACFLSQIEPTSIAKALSDSSWVEAMQEELLQFKLQQVWILVDLPNGKKAIGTKWVFRNKKDERGIVIRNKARLVAQGHRQEEGIDYEEVFAPVARIEAIRLFLAYASFMGFLVYVDDIIFGSTNKELCTGFEKLMKDKFQMSSMGELTFFLGLQVQQKEDGIFISQDKYVAEILKKFNYSDVKSASTLVDLEKPLVKDGDADDVDVHLYRSMIGSLMYLTASRPDIMFAVCACARFQVTPKTSHLLAVKRIFRYLKGKPTLGLWYSRDSPFELVAYTDSDYAGATQDRKSTTGGNYYCQAKVNAAEMTWAPKLQLLTKFLSLEALFEGRLLVGDEAVHKKLGDRMERSATTASSLEADPKFAETHNVVAFLEKPEESDGFAEIIDFLKASSVSYALTVNPVIYTSCIEQFWATAKRQEAEVPQDEAEHEESVPTPSNDPQPSGEDSMQLTNLMVLCTKLQTQVLDLQKAKDAQAKEIAALKKRIQDKMMINVLTLECLEDEEMHVKLKCFVPTTIEEITLAQTLIQIKAAKPKVVTTAATTTTTTTRPKDKGVVVQEPSEFRVPQETQPSSSKDKGKGIMIEPEVPLKRKDQIALDEQIARDIQAKLDAELLEEQKLARKQEEEANIALIESWENTQAMMEADRLLAERLQSKEREELTDEEKAKLFMELMEKRRKHFAALRAQEKRNRPPTKAQKRTQMSTYLKHMGGYTYKQLKGKSFDEIQKLFDKEMKRVNTFVAMGSEVQESKEKKEEGREETTKGSRKKMLGRKRAGKEQQKESSKKQKVEEEKESEEVDEIDEAELKKLLVIKKDEDITIDAIPLATKLPVIIDYKLHKEGMLVHYQLIRADGSSKRYSSMIRMLQGIDREDLEALWRIVKAKYGDTRPNNEFERVLWGDLKVMFEPDKRSDVWRILQGYKVTIWKLIDSSRVHFVRRNLKIQKMNIKFRGGLLGLKRLHGFLEVTAAQVHNGNYAKWFGINKELDDHIENVEEETVDAAVTGVSTISAPKAKEKGVSITDVEDSSRIVRPVRSITKLQPLSTIDPKDKGKGVLVKEEPMKIKMRDQAHEEQEKYTIEERARLLAEFFDQRKKQLAAARAEAIRTNHLQNSIQNMNITYLKHIGESEESAKKQKLEDVVEEQESPKSDEEAAADYEHEKEELRMWLTVVSDEEETVDPKILSAKYPIVDWETQT